MSVKTDLIQAAAHASMVAAAEVLMDEMRPRLESERRDVVAFALVNLLVGFVLAEDSQAEAVGVVDAIEARLREGVSQFWQPAEIIPAGPVN